MSKPSDIIHESWSYLKPLLNEPQLVELREKTLGTIVYPQPENIFRVFKQPLSDVKVVILGQDPYHGPRQANGLCFAVQPHIPIPPSLRIIKEEIQNSSEGTKWKEAFEAHKDDISWRTLSHWEQQGVFLLNTALTVEQGNAGSHLKEWRRFTEITIQYLSSKKGVIWLLWGKHAQSFLPHIYNPFLVTGYSDSTIRQIPYNPATNYVLFAPHPASELYKRGSGFLGCNHFKFANEILAVQKQKPINF